MFKLMKWGAIGSGLVLLVGLMIFGRNLTSYVCTSAREVQTAVEGNVPIEFQLKVALDMVNDIEPELNNSIAAIAEQSVDVARLEEEIAGGEKTLAANRKRLAMMRDKMDTQFVSYNDGSGRTRMQEQMASCLQRCKHGEQILDTKRHLLETRRQSLSAAERLLDRASQKKAELEQQVAALEAQHRLVLAQSINSSIHIDNSQLARADKLLEKIRRRLDVAQEVIERKAAFYSMGEADAAVAPTAVDEGALLANVDDYLTSAAAEEVEVAPQVADVERETLEVASH